MSLHKQFLKSKKKVKVTFSLEKEGLQDVKEVKVFGDFNNWEPEKAVPMKLKKDELVATVELEPDKEFEFKYLLDDKFWENDAKADKYAPSPFGVMNSVVMTYPENPEVMN